MLLVDINVLVYAYDSRDSVKQQRATEVLDLLATWRTGALSVQILGEFFVAATRRLPAPLTPAQAEHSLTNYVRSWPVYDLTPVAVMEAARGAQRYQLSYWDALIWATAKLNGISDILSEDGNDGEMLEGVRYLNPFTATFDMALLH